MKRSSLRQILVACGLLWLAGSACAEGVAVIGHRQLPRLDAATVQRLYTGRMVEIDGMPVTVFNAPPSAAVRQRFLQSFLNQDEDRYTAYWTVRKFIGKGLPPREWTNLAELIQFVTDTPGAIAYIDAADLKPGLHVLIRR